MRGIAAMIERYNLAEREKQIQHIQTLMQRDPHELFTQLEKDVYASTSAELWAIDLTLWVIQKLKKHKYPLLHLRSHSWRLHMYLQRLQPKVCNEWRFCEKVRDPQNTDRVELATQLADFLVAHVAYRSTIGALKLGRPGRGE